MKLIRPTTRQRRRCQRHHLHRRRPRRGSAAMADEHDGDAKLQSFLQWAADLGVSDSLPCPPRRRSCLGESLIVSHFPGAGGRGLAAAREVKRGEVVLKVPRSALMTRESLLKDEKLALLVKKYHNLSSNQVLCVLLLTEVGKGRDSSWAPYLMQLPRTYDTLSTFTSFEIKALQVDDAIWAAEKAVSKARSDWNEVVPLMKDIGLKPQLKTFSSWLWASATISSRTLHVPWDDAGCLCPVGDFFNYAAPEESFLYSEDLNGQAKCSPWQSTPFFNDEEKFGKPLDLVSSSENMFRLTDGGYEEHNSEYCFYARKNYRAGEQVLICYGTYTNLELLEHYGFLLDDNASDKAFIELDPSIISLSTWPSDSLHIQQGGKPSFALLSALRLWAASPNLRKSLGHHVYSGSMISLENEIFVMNWLAKKCCDVLNKLPSTMEADHSLLETIEEMQNQNIQVRGSSNEMEVGTDEINWFFEAVGVNNCAGINQTLLSNKVLRSMERWKLSVKWRFMHKKILSDCISYCNEVVCSMR